MEKTLGLGKSKGADTPSKCQHLSLYSRLSLRLSILGLSHSAHLP